MNLLYLVLALLLVACAAVPAQSSDTSPSSPPPTPESQRPTNQHHQPQLVSLKHHRYKSLRANVSSQSSNHILNVLPEDDGDDVHHHHHHYLLDDDGAPHKTPRSGLQLQKSPPDLQFGLAFTVPFVSLSTEKLLHTVSGKNFDSVSSLLKLNFSGLILAAVVGIVAVAGLFLPTILGPGGLGGLAGGGGGWGSPWFDGIAPHFTGEQYNDFENGWGGGDKQHGWRDGRGLLGGGIGRVLSSLRGSVTACAFEKVCEEAKAGRRGGLTALVLELRDNELVKNMEVVKGLGKVADGDTSSCSTNASDIKCVDGLEQMVEGMLRSWGGGSKDTGSPNKKQ